MSIRNLLLSTLCLGFLAVSPASAADSPTSEVRAAVTSVIDLLKDESMDQTTRRERMRAVIGERFDFRAMSQTILATNWRGTSDADRDRFVALFSQLLENTYVTAIETYTNESVEYPKEKIKGKKAVVDTFIVTTDKKIPVNYKMRLKKEQGWFVYDVVIEGISLVSNYRSSFGSIIRKDGMAGLLSSLETKIAELKAKQQAAQG